jgi:hypothetical protein
VINALRDASNETARPDGAFTELHLGNTLVDNSFIPALPRFPAWKAPNQINVADSAKTSKSK